MRISCVQIETPIVLEENSPIVLYIENPREYFNTINRLIDAFNGELSDITFWEGDTQIRADKSGELLVDLFSFELADRKIINLLYKQLQKNFLDGILLLQFNKASTEVEKFLQELCETVDFALDYDDIGLEMLLKGCSVRPAKNYDSFLEKIICYINIFSQLKNISFFVFVGLKTILTDEELSMLYKHCELNKISLLLLEAVKSRPRLSVERVIIVTDDLCELVENFTEI